MKIRPVLLLLAAALAASCGPVREPAYDLVVRNATVIDGTGAPGFPGTLAVRGDRIAVLSRGPLAADGRREIDARGLVLAPGFIDMHSHSDYLLLEDGSAQSKIRQGVTTEILGEETSGGPSKGKLPPHRQGKFEWTTLGGYFDALEKSGLSVNVASYVGQGNIWRCVLGDSFERPTSAQIEAMKALVAEAMEDGAWGLSCMLASPPGLLATTDDMVELCRALRPYGGLYSTHIRNEGTEVLAAVREAIDIGARAEVPVDIIHIKIAEQKLWGRMNEVIALIDEARRKGTNVQANVYPYTRGNNNLVTILPPWAREGGHEKMMARLRDPAERARMKKDILGGLPGWYNHYTAVGGDWSRMLVNAALSAANKRFEGRTMDRVLAERKNPPADPLDGMFDFLLEENGSIATIYAHHTEEDMNLAMRQPWCSIGSDGLAYATEGPLRRGVPHPRSFGTFPRVLGVYARERKLLPLETAVQKMTSLNARKIGLRDRGELREGAFADLTLFDPARVLDKATYLDPFQYADGIEYVIVNGQVVLDRGRHTEARAGRVLRRRDPIFASALKIEAEGDGAGEGPAWHPELGVLSSGQGHIHRLDAAGTTRVHRKDAGTNGLLFDTEGRLIACEPVRRRVTRTEADGTIAVLTDRYEGKRYNQPNDVAVDSKGRIYFTDPRYGSREGMEILDPDGKTIEGVYRIDPDGRVTRILGRELDRPNGILVSADDRFLFVADNNNTAGGARALWRFDLRADGTVDPAGRRKIHDWGQGRGPDGLKQDQKGRLYVAGGLNTPNPPHEPAADVKGGIYVFSPEGKLLDFLAVPRDEVTNCAFGGADRKTLYVTAGGTLYSVRTTTPGRLVWPR